MDVKTTISASQARKDLFEILEKVKSGQRYTLTKNGRPQAVIVGAEEFESIMETLEVMQECPNLLSEIKQAREDYERGEYVTLDKLRQGVYKK